MFTANPFDSVDHAFATHPDPFATSDPFASSPSKHVVGSNFGVTGPEISISSPEQTSSFCHQTGFNQKSFDNLIDFNTSFDPHPPRKFTHQTQLSEPVSTTIVTKPVRTLTCDEFEDFGSQSSGSHSLRGHNSHSPARRIDSLPNEQDAPPPTSTANPQTYGLFMVLYCILICNHSNVTRSVTNSHRMSVRLQKLLRERIRPTHECEEHLADPSRRVCLSLQ